MEKSIIYECGLRIVLEVKTKRGLKVIEKNIDEQIEIMTRVGFTASTF